MTFGLLMHEPDDDVGVAVADLEAGSDIGAVTLEGMPVGTVTLLAAVPLGHKVAVRHITKGRDVIEYGRTIGIATADAPRGSHVHVHNLASRRWGS